jgi:hypothetical protein
MDIKRLGSETYYRTEGFEIGFNHRLGKMGRFSKISQPFNDLVPERKPGFFVKIKGKSAG